MKAINTNISGSDFNKINNSLLKELNNLVYQYTTDYTFQHFDEMIAKLQDKIEWGFIYPHVKRREDKIAIIHYGDDETTRISIHKTFDYNEIYEDDVFFEQLLTSFRKYYLWLKETPDEEKQTLQSCRRGNDRWWTEPTPNLLQRALAEMPTHSSRWSNGIRTSHWRSL